MNYKKILFKFGPLLGLVFVYLLFLAVSPPEFHSFYNTKTILTQTVIIGIAALGMTIVIIARGIDLSVGSQIALGTVVIATVLQGSAGTFGTTLLAALAGIAACALCGYIIGLITARFNIVPFIVTLGMMQIARGVAKWIAKERTVSAPDNWLQSLMLVDPEPGWMVFAPGVWITIFILIITVVILKYTVFGRHVFAIGSNEETARLCGIKVKLNQIWIYVFCSALTGVASIMQFSNLTVGDPTAANGMELDIIAAVVIGGGSLNGGEGSAFGSIVGALIMAVLRNGCNMLGVPNYVQEIIIGSIIVGAVMVDRLKHKMKA